MHFACKSGNISLVKYLISLKKFDVNEKNVFEFFFYKVSTQIDFIWFYVKFLKEFIIIYFYQTPIDIARKLNFSEIADYLQEIAEVKAADQNQQSTNNDPPNNQ